jgi:hypothetical protein
MKVATHRSKSYFLEMAAIMHAAGVLKTEAVESAKDILPTSEAIPVVAAEVPTIKLKKSEPESSKTNKQPKLQSPPVM